MTAGILLLALLGILVWNTAGTVSLIDIDETYVGEIRSGEFAGSHMSAEGVFLLQSIIEEQSRPSFDPVRIVREQFWYNAVTEGYDLKIWIEPTTFKADKEQYAIYQRGKLLFLRIEYSRRNRVLVCDLSHGEVAEMLGPYLEET